MHLPLGGGSGVRPRLHGPELGHGPTLPEVVAGPLLGDLITLRVLVVHHGESKGSILHDAVRVQDGVDLWTVPGHISHPASDEGIIKALGQSCLWLKVCWQGSWCC